MGEGHSQHIFALDIGTRSVVGLLVVPSPEGKFEVIGYECEEHTERSMLDGQIHDVVAVAEVISRVKQRLETKVNVKLTDVAVAAAGRSLHTQRIEVSKDISGAGPISHNDSIALELAAIQKAQRILAKQHKANDFTQYYCVGYSVVNYFLDGEIIGSLIDQRGNEAKVEIIATFLPRVVVDSLIAALKRADLRMCALTLEPIAAINVLVPPTMRRLNVALVDIGAGTSDIAITGAGTVTAYGMVPIAGDEITEALSQAYLLDFPIAEEIKRKLSTQDTVTFSDILGIEYTYSREEVIRNIETDIHNLANLISERILELNGNPPQAVILIGGGSLTPTLPSKIAERLNLPPARVAVRGADAIQAFIGKANLTGPEFVTPLGIAVAAVKHPIKYLSIHLNGETLRIFDLKQMTVGDVLLYAGIDIKRLHGRPGLAMTVHVNGKMKIIPGGHGTAPVLLLNNEPAQLDTPVQAEDRIIFKPGKDGVPASAKPIELAGDTDTLDIMLNDTPLSLSPFIFINGQEASWDTPLKDRDEIEISLPSTLREVLIAAGAYRPEMETQQLPFTVNGKAMHYTYSTYVFTINGKEASLDNKIKKNDQILYRRHTTALPTIEDVLPPEERTEVNTIITFNGKTVQIPASEMEIYLDGERVALTEPIRAHASIAVRVRFTGDPIFSDVFRYVDESLQTMDSGKNLVITINGNPASFQDVIKTGDILECRWE
ncbi:cell division protein FtsA [Aneurinibacillus thermoaerophilus]|uniref:cell division protein FtsA n=1 Tax=Aneurinibacillus thermoaerophilus TaxID=143495 RepID=UPI002E22333D|nr:cell division protein FtsA [Aneurinibacillus thermoaerophilus]MED0761098.1 cell division protein FtsA [Aneurinibacillus thermoaerophilus]